MNTALIISGGEYDSSLPTIKYDYVIACDKGYKYALSLGITPDIVIGDFDSMPSSDISSNIPVLTHPVRKDDTDTMLAIKHALKHGYSNIHIICGLGNRLDHTYANIQSMHYVATHGGMCEMSSSREYLRTIIPSDGLVRINALDGFSLSLFALTDNVREVSINGTAYDCVTDLNNHFPLGLGNHFVSNYAEISIKEGALLVVLSHE